MKRILTFALILCTTGLMAQQSAAYQPFHMPKNVTAEWYMPQTVILKLKPELRSVAFKNSVSNQALNTYLARIGAQDFGKLHPNVKAPAMERNAQGLKYADLSLIYEFHYSANVPIEKVINRLLALGICEYAEPHYIHRLCYTPNDPSIGTQWHISKIGAYSAWNTTKGDTNVVIGLVDSGFDFNHPDLNDKVKKNTADPVNGIDDDGDGYTDNYTGWDLFGNDNNPQFGGSDHGVHVAGCAAPETDNGIGVAGPGFDCMLLPIKAGDGTTIDYGYQGIQLAADMGADVINCSWGGPGGGSYGQDIITYATVNQDALVVAAAGNDGTEGEFYPGYFDYVLNVASTDNTDAKSSFSNYGVGVDISAPGSLIYATLGNSTYGYNSGTSMASPIAAGSAALVKSAFPYLNAIQVGEQLKASAYDHYGVGGNAVYAGKLGTGRVDLANAVAGITSPSVVMTSRTVTDGNDDAFVIGDTLQIFGDYTNYLAPTGSVTATLTTTSGGVSIIDGTSVIGMITTLQTKNNNSDPFLVEIMPSATQNELVTFDLNLSDGNYSVDIYFNVFVNVDYVNITVNDVHTSITSKSLIGFNDFSTQLEGLGFRYVPGNYANLLFDGGLMVGVSGNVMDHVRNDQGTVDTDFASQLNVQKVTPVFSEFDTYGIFNDNPAGSGNMGLEVTHKAYAWSTPGNTKYVIVEFSIKNTSSGTFNNMYAGIFCDWDIMDYSVNRADEDVSRKLGYCWTTELNGFYAGVQVVSNTPFNNYSIQNDGGNGGMNIYDGYTTAEKYTSMSTSKQTAGPQDVSQVVSTGPFTVNAGDSVVVAFALLAGDDLADLQASADSSYAHYNGSVGIRTGTASELMLSNVYPNPADNMASVDFYLPKGGTVTWQMLDVLGKVVSEETTTMSQGTHRKSIDLSNIAPGTYFLKMQASDRVLSRPFVNNR